MGIPTLDNPVTAYLIDFSALSGPALAFLQPILPEGIECTVHPRRETLAPRNVEGIEDVLFCRQ